MHRGVYALSVEATDAYEAARARVARFLRAQDPSEVVFLRGTTEAINLIATSLGRKFLRKGDRVLTTVMEHHSNIVPWHLLREYSGIELDFLEIDDHGRLKLDDLDRKLDRRTKVVTLSHVSNVLGTVNPVKEIAERAHAVGALVVVDAAQSAPHRPLDVGALGADFLAFSGHKTLGPMGIGALWGRAELLETMPPAMGGGEMIREVHHDRVSYREAPAKFEAGTPNVAGAVALSAALDYLEGVGWDDLRSHEHRLFDRATRLARERLGDEITVFGPQGSDDREAILSFRLKGVHPHDVASLLDAKGICVRGRAPLCPAAHGAPGRPGPHAGESVPLQHRRGDRPTLRWPRGGRSDLPWPGPFHEGVVLRAKWPPGEEVARAGPTVASGPTLGPATVRFSRLWRLSLRRQPTI